jgi:hypothetical protein
MDVQIGQTYVHRKYPEIEYVVHSITKDSCRLTFKGGEPFLAQIDSLLRVAILKGSKPLDQAIQKLDKVYCTHKNIAEERYFSAMMYRTCKDCGHKLN